MIEYGKLDAALAQACAETAADTDRFLVFLQTAAAPSARQVKELHALGVEQAAATRQRFTATLSRRQIEELSQQTWVRAIRLSQKLQALPKDAGSS